mmetsp:Transcript_134205/g.388480  ORF Transcript_134205/g.388480 Transcript_134205/m.388480 type:complete len:242 (-) Transcript_134205:119-844(-)
MRLQARLACQLEPVREVHAIVSPGYGVQMAVPAVQLQHSVDPSAVTIQTQVLARCCAQGVPDCGRTSLRVRRKRLDHSTCSDRERGIRGTRTPSAAHHEVALAVDGGGLVRARCGRRVGQRTVPGPAAGLRLAAADLDAHLHCFRRLRLGLRHRRLKLSGRPRGLLRCRHLRHNSDRSEGVGTVDINAPAHCPRHGARSPSLWPTSGPRAPLLMDCAILSRSRRVRIMQTQRDVGSCGPCA